MSDEEYRHPREIPHLTRACRKGFVDILRAQGTPDDVCEWAQNQRASLGLWAASLGVFAEGRLSIEYRLRLNNTFTVVILHILEGVKSCLDICHSIVISSSDHASASGQSQDSQRSWRNLKSKLRHPKHRHFPRSLISTEAHKWSRLSFIQSEADDDISHLIDISGYLRRAWTQREEERALRFEPKDGMNASLVDEFRAHMLLQCRFHFEIDCVQHDQTQLTSNADARKAVLDRHYNQVPLQCPTDPEIVDRVYETIILRWRLICYRIQHAEKFAAEDATSDSASSIALQPVRNVRKPRKPARDKSNNDNYAPNIHGPPPTLGQSTAATEISANRPLPERQAQRPNKQYGAASMTRVGISGIEFPSAPKVEAGNQNALCTLCRIIMPKSELQGDSWRSHILRDLGPYICVFNSCPSPRTRYSTKELWKQHLSTAHVDTFWICAECAWTSPGKERFESSDEFDRHIQQHTPLMSSMDRAFILEHSSRRAPHTLEACIFCKGCGNLGGEDPYEHWQRLLQHIADDHLKVLSLLSLPWDISASQSRKSSKSDKIINASDGQQSIDGELKLMQKSQPLEVIFDSATVLWEVEQLKHDVSQEEREARTELWLRGLADHLDPEGSEIETPSALHEVEADDVPDPSSRQSLSSDEPITVVTDPRVEQRGPSFKDLLGFGNKAGVPRGSRFRNLFSRARLRPDSEMGSKDSGPASEMVLEPPADDALGATVLYDAAHNSLIDIVFVHGLKGASITTWLHPQTGFFWPLDIPETIEPLRIITFGYDVDDNIVLSHGRNHLAEYAHNLMTDLVDLRYDEDMMKRPIMFVAHSIGGLIVKKALTLSSASSRANLRTISQCTVAILFLGTPHADTDLAISGRIITLPPQHIKRDLFRPTKGEPSILIDLQRDFGQLVAQRLGQATPMDITCAYEQLTTPGVGDSGLVVERESAVLPGSHHFCVFADHMNMTKFKGKGDLNYVIVLEEIERSVRKLQAGSHEPKIDVQQSVDLEDCIKSLYFEEIDQRPSEIANLHSGSFKWFWSEKVFHAWLGSPRYPLWIQGKPGSGKSTLMKHLAQSPELREHLRRVSNSQSYAVAFYSFHANSSDIAGSPNGMLRSLLWQLITRLPPTEKWIVRQYKSMKVEQKSTPWTFENLQLALLNFFEESTPTAICVLIDAPEAHRGKDESIVHLIANLSRVIPSNVRLCVASRHMPAIASQFREAQVLTMEEFNNSDISAYVEARLREIPSELPSVRDHEYGPLTAHLTQKASGSFLWTKLACDKLIANWYMSGSIESLQSCLDSLSPDLDLLYQQTLDQVTVEEKDDLARMLTILVESERPLTVPEFCHAFDLSKTDADRSSTLLLPSQLQPLLANLYYENLIPANCDCNIAWCTYDLKNGNHGITDKAPLFIGPPPPFGLAPLNFKPAATCPHTGAYTCRNSQVPSIKWLEDVVRRINTVSKGLVRADTSSVSVTHTTVASFWASEGSVIWPRPARHKGTMLLQSCLLYLEILLNYRFIPPERIAQEGWERLYLHYPFLEFALSELQHRWEDLKEASQNPRAEQLWEFVNRVWQ